MPNPEVNNERERVIECEKIPGLEMHAGKKVIIRRLSFGDKADMQDAIVQIKLNEQTIKIGQLRLFALAFGIREAPFFDGEVGVNAIRWDQGIKPNQLATRIYVLRNIEEETGLELLENVYDINPGLLAGLGSKKKESTGFSKEEPEMQPQQE